MTNHTTTRIKICGITSLADAEQAIAAGADYLGLIFVRESPRGILPAVAEEIARMAKGKAETVGVFRNAPFVSVMELRARVGFDLVQLHGDESVEFCRAMTIPAIKVFEITPKLTVDKVQRYASVVPYMLFDRAKTGIFANWKEQSGAFITKLREEIPELPDFFFAGGLSPETVGEVVRTLDPFGVDVASGVERTAGIKDFEKMSAFCRACRGVRAAGG